MELVAALALATVTTRSKVGRLVATVFDVAKLGLASRSLSSSSSGSNTELADTSRPPSAVQRCV